MDKKEFILIILIVLFLFVIIYYCEAQESPYTNPFPPNPKVTPQEGDDELIEVPLITLRNALLISDLYKESLDYIDFILPLYKESEDNIIELNNNNKILSTIVAILGVSTGVLVVVLIFK